MDWRNRTNRKSQKSAPWQSWDAVVTAADIGDEIEGGGYVFRVAGKIGGYARTQMLCHKHEGPCAGSGSRCPGSGDVWA